MALSKKSFTMKNNICVLIMLFCFVVAVPVMAQKQSLTVGDKVPDLVLNNVVNYTSPRLELSDFRGKLMIIDFWASWCMPCVAMLPICDSLQQEFKDSLQIVPVTQQDKATVAAFIQNIRHAKNISFFSIGGDTVLNTLFTHKEIPHYVWVDATGKVVAITGAHEINREAIRRYLKTGTIDAAVKTDSFRQVNEKQPLFHVANNLIENGGIQTELIPDNNLLYHSVLTGYIEGFGTETGGDTDRIVCKNNSVGGLYRYALSNYDVRKLFLNSTVWKVTNPRALALTDSAAFAVTTQAEATQWMKAHTFCYELKCPAATADKPAIMLQDLNNYFGALYGIQGKLETIDTKVLALTKLDDKSLYATKGIAEKTTANQFHLAIKDQPLSTLINFLGAQMDWLPPLTDETGYTGKADIELNCDLTNLNEVNAALSVYGLVLKEKIEEREMIVIRDR